MRRKLEWLVTAGAALLWWGTASAPAQQAGEPQGAYERLDESRLAARLKDLQMTELLDALLQQSGRFERIEAMYLQSQAKIAAARGARDPSKRNALLDEAIAIQDRLVEQTRQATSSKELLRHYRYALDRAITEGITKSHGYVERLEYFLGRADDAAQVAKLTGSSLKILDRLMGQMQMKRDDWAGDDEELVTGNIWRLEELIGEAGYRGAWIRLYRGTALARDSRERSPLLHQAIEAVADFANAEDNSSGVKFTSLLLSGMAARELGEWQNADGYLKRAAHKDAGALRLKAMFEMARALIEQKKFVEAGNFIDGEFAAVGRAAVGPVAVEMQSSLLKSRLLELQAESVRPANPQRGEELTGQSIQILLDFIKKRPEYREAFMEVIAPKFEGRDAEGQPPAIQVALGVWHYNKRTAEDIAHASELFLAVRKRPDAGYSAEAAALWYLGLISNSRRQNRQAAVYFVELAEKHPRDPRAKDAALNALRSLNGILEDKSAEPHELGKEFVEQYAHVLKVLTRGWAGSDPNVRLKCYDLGIQYETLGRAAEAVEAFGQVPADSELYLPSRYRILDLRVQELLDKPLPAGAKRQLASNLITELSEYRLRASEYANQVVRAKPARAGQVRSWAARCHMLEAQLYKDILDQPTTAIDVARRAAADWPAETNIQAVSQQFVVRVLLETGQTDQAIEILEKLTGAEELLAETVNQIRVRIDRLEVQTDPSSAAEIQKYRKAYRVFAERLYGTAKGRGLSAKQMYPFEQALAGAYEFGTAEEAAKALEMYRKLDEARPSEAMNIRGLARCLRRVGKSKEAMEYYDRLIDGLPGKSASWWRAQLERLEFFLEAHGDDADGLRDLLVHIRQLRRYFGGGLGGFHKQFGVIEGKVAQLLKATSQDRP